MAYVHSAILLVIIGAERVEGHSPGRFTQIQPRHTIKRDEDILPDLYGRAVKHFIVK